MIEQSEMKRFIALRKRFFEAIRRELEIDCHCKSYEGTFEIMVCYPNYFEDYDAESTPILWVIELHCYVIGPGRHYRWDGRTFKEAVCKAERQIDSWLRGMQDE